MRCHIHSVDHEVPYASLEWDVGSVGGLLHLCGNTTEEEALQAHWLVVGKRCLPPGLLVHLNHEGSGGTKHPQTSARQTGNALTLNAVAQVGTSTRLEEDSEPAGQPLDAQRVLSPIVQRALLWSPGDATRTVAASEQQDLQRAFVQQD